MKDQLRAKKRRLAYIQKRAKELGVSVERFINDCKERDKKMQRERIRKSKQDRVHFIAKVASGESKRTLEASTVFVQISYRDIQTYGKVKKPKLKDVQERLDCEDKIMNELDARCLKKLKAAKVLGKYSKGWENFGSAVTYNFAVTDPVKATSLLKQCFKQRSYLKKFKIYSYGYYTDQTEDLLAKEIVVNS